MIAERFARRGYVVVMQVRMVHANVPSALRRMPCNHSELSLFVIMTLRHGIQDCRGRYLSEGRFTKYTNEGDDGVDTLEWICAQPWSNGKVGCYGLSYCAHVQVSLACRAPPGEGGKESVSCVEGELEL